MLVLIWETKHQDNYWMANMKNICVVQNFVRGTEASMTVTVYDLSFFFSFTKNC
jgi:hypothetical protein